MIWNGATDDKAKQVYWQTVHHQSHRLRNLKRSGCGCEMKLFHKRVCWGSCVVNIPLLLFSCCFSVLSLKEMYPRAFEDLCLYCEVSDTMGLYKFKLPIRRFIQGLFDNVTFTPVSAFTRPIDLLLKELSILMLGTPCGLSIWLSQLVILNTLFWVYANFFTRKRIKYLKSAIFVW